MTGATLALGGVIATVAVLVVPAAFAFTPPPKCEKSFGVAWGTFSPSRGHPGDLVTITLTSGVQKVFGVLWPNGSGGVVGSVASNKYNTPGFTGNADQLQVHVPMSAVTGVLRLDMIPTSTCWLASPNRFTVQ